MKNLVKICIVLVLSGLLLTGTILWAAPEVGHVRDIASWAVNRIRMFSAHSRITRVMKLSLDCYCCAQKG